MAGWLVVAWLGALVAVGWLRGWVGLALLAGDSYGIGNWFRYIDTYGVHIYMYMYMYINNYTCVCTLCIVAALSLSWAGSSLN